MAILNYTTTIKAERTLVEIQSILTKRGASKISIDYASGLPVNLTFVCQFNNEQAFFSLPCRFSGIRKRLNKQSRIKKNDEQAINVGWRTLKTWIEVQFEMVESEMAELPEIFLPYGVTKDGTRLYDYIKALPPSNGPLLLS
jgi:hypothetical protein